jgi:hypothetical protein
VVLTAVTKRILSHNDGDSRFLETTTFTYQHGTTSHMTVTFLTTMTLQIFTKEERYVSTLQSIPNYPWALQLLAD